MTLAPALVPMCNWGNVNRAWSEATLQDKAKQAG